ncbi:MAG TPA: CPCC family cysteine-rich protein [Candidatus Saccharimonadales bacterium]|nr:CPCC family cysteine-rich protein [Candidatus Saccharimonadales bacterium]
MKRIRSFAFTAVPQGLNSQDEERTVAILVTEEKDKKYFLNRYTKKGQLLSQTKHATLKEAEELGEKEYHELVVHWLEVEGIKDEIDEILDTYKTIAWLGISESKNSTVVKIGSHEITGFVDFQRCGTCNTLRIYNDKYDRFFCPTCNKWLESRCNDPSCEMCRSTPDKPLKKYFCPCCGYKTLDEKPSGTYDICSVCFWEDDDIQFDDPDYKGGANDESLHEARKNFQEFGACEKRVLKYVRKPTEDDARNMNWKALGYPE